MGRGRTPRTQGKLSGRFGVTSFYLTHADVCFSHEFSLEG